MLEKYDPVSRIPDNTKAGITVMINQDKEEDPLEATFYFKKSGKSAEEITDEKAINLTASAKLRLDIGKTAFVEVFAEKTNRLLDAPADETPDSMEE